MKNIFKDSHGNTVIAQKPNLPMKVWLVAFLLSKLPLTQLITDISSLVAFGAIFTWAWLEIFDGTNVWRRILGTIVMIVILSLRI